MTQGTQRTVSIGFDPRAQTNQDFVIGIGVFIIAVAFVFTTIPDIVGVYSGTSDSGDVAQVDRVAGTVLENESLETGTPNQIDGEGFNQTFVQEGLDNSSLGLRADDGYRFDQINVTIEPLEREGGQPRPLNLSGDGDPLAAGDRYDDQSAVTATRIVTVTDVDDDEYPDVDSEHPVRLVVRMW
ncbi:hypothetical protein D8Y22_20445 [Salinadaptatus halalkaliphilus]|uniref:Uncharacterized protein n=1 Tax=Salinadaptatus halalkaliphilus TaxID=2419781 RepID=A0A4S3THZ1_9EURY|nr:hypothetical protein [Salinadaptatus halalkaliphilus]THE62833.1 hypothetical protein D8Y22_20445 [Salinadaptatus halalkaliphilus]